MAHPKRSLWLKILYQFDDRPACIARSSQACSVVVADEQGVGQVDLASCLETVTTCAPDVLVANSSDYAVYSTDYSEEGEPSVGHGALSGLLAGSGDTLIGKICSGSLPFGKAKPSLQVKLRFVEIRGRSLQKPVAAEDEKHRFSSPIDDQSENSAYNSPAQPLSHTQTSLHMPPADSPSPALLAADNGPYSYGEDEDRPASSPPTHDTRAPTPTPRDSPQVDPSTTPCPVPDTPGVEPSPAPPPEQKTNANQDKTKTKGGRQAEKRKRSTPRPIEPKSKPEEGAYARPLKRRPLLSPLPKKRGAPERGPCKNCGVEETCQWRVVKGLALCNPCGLYYLNKQSHRPVTLFGPGANKGRSGRPFKKLSFYEINKLNNESQTPESQPTAPATATNKNTKSFPAGPLQPQPRRAGAAHTSPIKPPASHNVASPAPASSGANPASSPPRKPTTTNYYEDEDKENMDPALNADIDALFSSPPFHVDEPPSLTTNLTSDNKPSSKNVSPSKWMSSLLEGNDADLAKTFLDSSPMKSSKRFHYDDDFFLGIDCLSSDPVDPHPPSSPPSTFIYLSADDDHKKAKSATN